MKTQPNTNNLTKENSKFAAIFQIHNIHTHPKPNHLRENCANMDNGTDFASGFVRIAMEEFYAHNSNNLTGLVKRYWDIVDQELAGNNSENI